MSKTLRFKIVVKFRHFSFNDIFLLLSKRISSCLVLATSCIQKFFFLNSILCNLDFQRGARGVCSDILRRHTIWRNLHLSCDVTKNCQNKGGDFIKFLGFLRKPQLLIVWFFYSILGSRIRFWLQNSLILEKRKFET